MTFGSNLSNNEKGDIIHSKARLSFLYRLICLGLFFIGSKFFSTSIVDDLALIIIGLIAYKLVGIILRGIGFWRY